MPYHDFSFQQNKQAMLRYAKANPSEIVQLPIACTPCFARVLSVHTGQSNTEQHINGCWFVWLLLRSTCCCFCSVNHHEQLFTVQICCTDPETAPSLSGGCMALITCSAPLELMLVLSQCSLLPCKKFFERLDHQFCLFLSILQLQASCVM